jgi:hypothetical protein
MATAIETLAGGVLKAKHRAYNTKAGFAVTEYKCPRKSETGCEWGLRLETDAAGTKVLVVGTHDHDDLDFSTRIPEVLRDGMKPLIIAGQTPSFILKQLQIDFPKNTQDLKIEKVCARARGVQALFIIIFFAQLL